MLFRSDNTVNFYRECVKRLLSEYELLQDESSKIELIFDDQRMRYLALWVGWHQYKRVHQCCLHIDIVEIDDSYRLLIQRNDTEESIVAELAEMGISEDKISLGFVHPQHQKYLEQQADVVSVGSS